MPQPGDAITAFSVQPGRCFRMVYSRQLQATHCREPPLWKGIWKDAKGKSWYVEACRDHAPKLSRWPCGGSILTCVSPGNPESGRGARYEITKTYPQRGPLQQYRLVSSTAFPCFRCGKPKTSKLITVFGGNWDRLLCNGCYGLLLSIYEIQAGDASIDSKAESLAERLSSMASVEQRRRAQEILRLRDKRTNLLDERSLRLLATSDFVAEGLAGATGLDWSAAIIGVCKAAEVELISRLIGPLVEACRGVDLTTDIDDKDLGRVARYCGGRTETPPEIGVTRHFLMTAANSKSRRNTSPLLSRFFDLIRAWPHSDWLITSRGASQGFEELVTRFRNRAAHTDELGKDDYEKCITLVTGTSGILWELLRSTTKAR